MMGEIAWTNPQTQGHGRAESLKAVMLAMKEGKEYSPEETEAMREMYKKVMAGEKELVDFGYLVDRVAPPLIVEPPPPPEPVEPVPVIENCSLDLREVRI